jgi:fucose 4-O-acetylase-like acetyltransferase
MTRNRTIDVARGLAIALVVLGHNRIGETAIATLYAFHVHTFFLLTGVTFGFARYRDDPAGLARDRFRRLVVPYLFSAAGFYLLWYFVARRFGEDAGRPIPAWKPALGILYGNGVGDWLVFNAPLWFLPALFVAGLLLWAVLRAAERWSVPARAALVLAGAAAGYAVSRIVLLPWGADLALVALAFMYLGYELNRRGLLRDGRPLLSIPAAILAAGVLALVVAGNGAVDMAQRRYHVLPLFLLGGIAGGALVLQASGWIARWERPAALFTLLGRESLVVLVFHLLGMQVLSAALVFGLGVDAEAAMRRFWWAYAAFGIAFSLAVAAVVRRVPPLRAVYYGSAAPRGPVAAPLPPGSPATSR